MGRRGERDWSEVGVRESGRLFVGRAVGARVVHFAEQSGLAATVGRPRRKTITTGDTEGAGEKAGSTVRMGGAKR